MHTGEVTELSSSKNPYGSKTNNVGMIYNIKLSSSKNPYGSKTSGARSTPQ